ncbi:MAG: hypothetical protein ACXVBP_04155 [Flavisolibacter sp.]
MVKTKSFWINLCLVNLCLVAFLGLCLRSKILFPLPFIDYRNFLSAHSHFAFAGWAGLSLTVMLVYELLPPALSRKKIYQWIYWSLEISSLGMMLSFPFGGYNALSIFFSTLYIMATLVFAPVFLKDLARTPTEPATRLLGITSILSLLASYLGTAGLVYILLTHSTNANAYRDALYTFLHFQYNGFFSCAVFALFFHYLSGRGILINRHAFRFATCLSLSLLPALFLSLLWHGNAFLYIPAATGALLIGGSLLYLGLFLRDSQPWKVFSNRTGLVLWTLSIYSFGLKMLLNAGTVLPALGRAVYGDRPVIIGFLHLVFLGFLSFYILGMLVEGGYFTRKTGIILYPLFIFSLGIIANEFLLMLQGLGILFKTNNAVYPWLLWITAIILFTGALLIALTRLSVTKKMGPSPPAIPD